MVRIYFLVVAAIVVLSSCEKAIHFDLDKVDSQLVVEATIENDQYPMVFLSKSLNYFSQIDATILSQSFVHGAKIFISNDTKTQQLKEYGVQADAAGDSIYYYSTDTSFSPNAFKGSFDTGYGLRIENGSEVYTSQTTITSVARKIDSLWWIPAPFQEDVDSGRVILMARMTDPAGLGNYIRYFTRVNYQPFFPGLNSVFDDQVTDGTTYNIAIDQGVNRNQTIDFNTYTFFHHGDSITVKLSNIDKATFDFWRTMEYSYQSIGNPFSTPTKVIGNISNGALGYFGGYATQYESLVVPPQ